MKTQKQADTAEQEAQTSTAEIPVLNPLAEPISHFEDDPFWDEMMDSIRRHRQELDAAWNNVE